MAETPEQKAEREEKEAAAAAGGAPAATAEKTEDKPGLLNVSVLVKYFCPSCGEVVNASEEEETDELELSKENNYRAELPPDTGTCDFCKAPIARKKFVVAFL